MCGIAGFYSFTSTLEKGDLQKMAHCIRHRGPDAEGFFFENKLGLAHRRLSILDLSERSNQPMHSECGDYVIVFNGEVYNFREIATKYTIPTQTSSDTEVILKAYIKVGKAFIQDLIGMFAFAIYEKRTKKLVIYRDRVGIKPLYYYYDKENFVFASEIKALLGIPAIRSKAEMSSSIVSTYLHLGYIPTPHTIYKNIYKLPSGSCLQLDATGHLQLEEYWKPQHFISSETKRNEVQVIKDVDTLIQSSVAYCMISDVPLGSFLSGGIDSSLVAAIAQKQSTQPINTFSIGFKEAKYDESAHAREVANYIGSNHHEFIVSTQDAIPLLEDIFSIYDEPMTFASAIPTLLVSKLTRQHVTVALSGDGGDEAFGGYGFYNWAKRLSNPFIKLGRKPIYHALSLMDQRAQRAAKVFNYPTEAYIKSHIFSQEQYYFSRQEIAKLIHPKLSKEILLEEKLSDLKRKLRAQEEQSLFDQTYYLPDEMLHRVDIASMKYSLEVRVPLLDHRLIEYALNIDPSIKFKEGKLKHVLKQVLYQYIPQQYFERPKWGFTIPIAQWLKTDLNYLIQDNLSKARVEEASFVQYSYVEELLKQFYGGKDYLQQRVWLLVLLHKWHKNMQA